MKRLAALAIAVFLGAMCVEGQQAHPAPKSSWVKSEIYDPLRRMSFEQFVLDGKFLVPPRETSLRRPRITVECEPGRHNYARTMGHVFESWIDTGAVLDATDAGNLGVQPVELGSGVTLPYAVAVEYRRDNEKQLQQNAWPTTEKGTSAYLGVVPFCNGCPLTELLYGHIIVYADKLNPVHQLIIGLPEYGGGEIEMQFNIPNPREVGDACGLITYPKREWKGEGHEKR